jgi:hypothetical protein
MADKLDNLTAEQLDYEMKNLTEKLQAYGIQIIRTEPVQKQGEFKEEFH